MSSTNSTNGPGNEDETPQQKRERESSERLNRQYRERHGLPAQPDDTTEQDETSPASTPESVDLGTSKDVDDLIDATREQVNKGLSPNKKKYLSLEEAAEMLGMTPAELTELRKEGLIRAYADRGQWKFKKDDLDALRKERAEEAATINLDDDLKPRAAYDSDIDLESSGVDLGGFSDDSGINLDTIDDSAITPGSQTDDSDADFLIHNPELDEELSGPPSYFGGSTPDKKSKPDPEDSNSDFELTASSLDDDSGYELPEFPNSNPAFLEDSESDSDIPVFNADSDADFEYTAPPLDDDDESNVLEFDDENEWGGLGEENDSIPDDDSDEEVDNSEDAVNEEGDAIPEDKKVINDEVIDPEFADNFSDTEKTWAEWFTKKRDAVAESLSDKSVTALGSVTGASAGSFLGYLSINSVAMGAPTALISLPLAGTGNAIADGARIAWGKVNANKIHLEDAQKDILAKYSEVDKDLIDTQQEQDIAEIASKLGVLDLKKFPILATEEQYAEEVFARIAPLFLDIDTAYTARARAMTDQKMRKILGSDLYEKGIAISNPGTSTLQSEALHQVSVQLGRMIYTYHMNQNKVGRAVGVTGSLAASALTGFTILPAATSLGYEVARYIRYRARKNASHLCFNAKGELVNTADGKKDLALPLTNQQKKDAKAKPLKLEKLKELKEERDEAKNSAKKIGEDINSLENDIRKAGNEINICESKINEIKLKASTRELTPDQEEKIQKFNNEIEELDQKVQEFEIEKGRRLQEATDLDRQIQEAKEKKHIEEGKITTCVNKKLQYQNAIDPLDIEKDRLGTEIREIEAILRDKENGLSSADINEKKKDLQEKKKQLNEILQQIAGIQKDIDKQDRQLALSEKIIKDLYLDHSETRRKNIDDNVSKLNRDIANALRKKKDANNSIERITKIGNSKELTAAEKGEIEALERKIKDLDVPSLIIKKEKKNSEKIEAEQEYKELKKEYDKQEAIADAAAEEKPQTMTGKAKKAVTEKVLQFAKDEIVPLVGWTTGSGLAGAVGITILNTVSTASQYLINPVTGAVSAAGFATIVYLMNRIRSSAGARSVDTTPDTK